MAAIRRLLLQDSARLVALTGAGGTGKTRLGLEVAANLTDDFQDGVFLVNLAPISEPGLVAATIVTTLGVHEIPGQPLQDSLKDSLRERHLLLFLDNFEQVIEAAPLVAELLAACPRLQVLVTSREPLHVRGEKEFLVQPLEAPTAADMLCKSPQQLRQYAAIELFVQRAADIKPDFALTEENAPAVANICARLDALPLAIELAAARIRLLPPQAMLEQLLGVHGLTPLQFLTAGPRDLPVRQQTMRATIAWSYDLLDDRDKMLFRRLAVFAGGFTLEAVEAVCTGNEQLGMDVLGGVGSLVRKNLLQREERDGEARFTMLETIGEYAREKLLEAGEDERVRDQHLNAFLQLAEKASPKLFGAEAVPWMERLERDHDNLRSALRWALVRGASAAALRMSWALAWFWWVRGHLSEGREWAHQALALSRRTDDLDRMTADYRRWYAWALLAAATFASAQGDYATVRGLAEESLGLFRELGDKRGAALSLHWLGIAALYTRDYSGAYTLFEERLALSREEGDRWEVGIGLAFLGVVAIHRGDYPAARGFYEQAYALYQELGDQRNVAWSLDMLGLVDGYEGDFVTARVRHTEALAVFRKLGDIKAIAECLPGLARVAEADRQPRRAAKLLGAADSLLARIGIRVDPTKREVWDSTLNAVYMQLDAPTFEAVWAAGHALTLDEAVGYALEDTSSES